MPSSNNFIEGIQKHRVKTITGEKLYKHVNIANAIGYKKLINLYGKVYVFTFMKLKRNI